MVNYLNFSLKGETLQNCNIKLDGCNLKHYDHSLSRLVFSAHELIVDHDVDWEPSELRFYVTNFQFIGNTPEITDRLYQLIIHLQYKGYDIAIRRVDYYNDIMSRIEKTNGIDVTSIMTVKLPPNAAYTVDLINNAIDIASNICSLLSLAQGHKIDWIYYEIISEKDEIMRSYHRLPRMNRGYNIWHLILDNPNEDLEDYLNQSLDNYARKKEPLKLDECIELYLNALIEDNYLDFQCLLLAVLLDSLSGYMYPNLDDNFKLKLETLTRDLKIQMSADEVDEIIDIRNHLAHNARLLNVYETSKSKMERDGCEKIIRINMRRGIDQFFLILSYVGRVMLAILNYDGYYYDWRFHVPGEWKGEGLTGRIKMKYISP